MKMQCEILTVGEASQYLDITISNVKRRCRLGHLKYFRVGGYRLRFLRSELERFKEEYGHVKPYRKLA